MQKKRGSDEIFSRCPHMAASDVSLRPRCNMVKPLESNAGKPRAALFVITYIANDFSRMRQGRKRKTVYGQLTVIAEYSIFSVQEANNAAVQHPSQSAFCCPSEFP
jgi:hypothetical protein